MDNTLVKPLKGLTAEQLQVLANNCFAYTELSTKYERYVAKVMQKSVPTRKIGQEAWDALTGKTERRSAAVDARRKELAVRKEEFTVEQVSSEYKIAVTTARRDLSNLYKDKLVDRRSIDVNGALLHFYRGIVNSNFEQIK